MSSLHTGSVLALAGLYSAAALFLAVATVASTAPSFPVAVHQLQWVDRTRKGDLLMHSKTPKDTGTSISVELSARSDVIIRDKAGNVLFAVDNTARATTMAKQSSRSTPPL